MLLLHLQFGQKNNQQLLYFFLSLYCTTKAKSTDIWFVTMATNMEEETVPNVDEQAFDPAQPPTYDAAFPALTTETRSDRGLVNSGAWQPKFQARTSKCTQVMCMCVHLFLEGRYEFLILFLPYSVHLQLFNGFGGRGGWDK